MEHSDVGKLEESVRCRLAGRVDDFRVLLRDTGLVLQGHCHSHHVKQLAQHLVVQATHVPLLANDIKVLQRSHPGSDLKSRGFKGNVGYG